MASFISSNISVTNRAEGLSLFFYNCCLSERITILKPLCKTLEQQIFSRVAGLLISFAAALDLAVHLIILPFALAYAIGRSIYNRKCDFILPYHHLQRVRDAVFPLLFGSLFGLIHPYLGTYAAEPTKKHIATGILLSGTAKDKFDTVCSPLTTMSEVTILNSQMDENFRLSKQERKWLKQIQFWEGEFEKIQSIDFFNLRLTYKLSRNIQLTIDDSRLPLLLKEIAKRISLATYPIFMSLDLTIMAFATIISLGTLVVKIIGGQSPAYLEKAWTPEVLIYNIVKIPLFLISATLGFILSLFHPETGLMCHRYSMDGLAWVPFKIKLLGLKLRLRMMKIGDTIILPSVEVFSPEKMAKSRLPLLPTYGSHMRYLLIEKTEEDTFQAELIERGPLHKKTLVLSRAGMGHVMEGALAKRYSFSHWKKEEVFEGFIRDPSIDLGLQKGINNCIVTNLFAAIQVLRHRGGKNDFNDFCQELKAHAFRRYYMYAFDFYPFGQSREVVQEIDLVFSRHI